MVALQPGIQKWTLWPKSRPMMRLSKREVRRILLLRLGKIGDVLLTTPLVRQLRQNFPKAHITYIVGPSAAPILENNPDISELIISDKNIFSRLMKQAPYDLAIDLNVLPVTAQLCWLSGAKYRAAAYEEKWLARHYSIILGKPAGRIDVVSYFLSLLKELGLSCRGDKTTEVFLTRQERAFAGRRLRPGGKRIIGIQPGSDTARALWPVKNFSRLADALVGEYNYDVVIFQGAGKDQRAVRMRRYMRQKAVLLPVARLREDLALLSGCDLFVAHEGGQIHMAKAMGLPAVGIFASKPDDYWYAHYEDKFSAAHSPDIRDVPVAQVLDQIQRLAPKTPRGAYRSAVPAARA
jgi:ADP-heptose:LPS heptosyltransferase